MDGPGIFIYLGRVHGSAPQTGCAQLTILLALKDRVPYTLRWFDYAVRQKFACRILVADGGSDRSVAMAAGAQRERGLDVEYVRYPFDATYSDYFGKIADALGRVTTPYVVMADNDDFFVPDALEKAQQFLNANRDYVACGGQASAFWVASANGGQHDGALYGERVAWKVDAPMPSDAGDTALERVLDQSRGSSDVFYAVHRTALLRRHFEMVRQLNPVDLFLMEQLVAFLTAISGKCRQLELLYLARQQDSPGSSGAKHQEQFGGWFERMLLPTWSGDFDRFVEMSSTALAHADGIPLAAARRAILDSYKMSVAPTLLSELLCEPTVTPAMPLMLQTVHGLARRSPSSKIRKLARRLYRRLPWIAHDVVFGGRVRAKPTPDTPQACSAINAFLARRS